MVWPLLAAGGLSLLGGMQERAAQYDAQAAQNKAIREANLQNANRTGFQIGLLNVQRGLRLRQLAQRQSEIGQAELLSLASSSNNAAASGTVGNSVDAVRTDAQMQFERARSQIQLENEIEAQNFNTALYEVIQGGMDKSIEAVKVSGPSDLALLGKAAIGVGSAYFSSKMSLGLGTETSKPTASFRG